MPPLSAVSWILPENSKAYFEYLMFENTVQPYFWGTVLGLGIWARSHGWVGDIFLHTLRKEMELRTVGRYTDIYESHCLIVYFC